MSGAAARGATRTAGLGARKELHGVEKWYLNAAVFDSDWERQAAELVGKHPAVEVWGNNDRLGVGIPYCKDGSAKKYLSDFIMRVKSGV